MNTSALRFVPETRFGLWFLKTETWRVHVLQRAMDDLERLLPEPRPRFARILDIGTGHGYSLLELAARYAPEEIIALDADPSMPERAAAQIAACPVPVRVHPAHAEATGLPDACVDLVFCHQSFHHIVAQEAAMAEFFRVLKPGGWLLFAESTKAYIHSWVIRYLFAHPMDVQKTAEEYLSLAQDAGFERAPARESYPYLWWSRTDLGALEWLGLPVPPRGRRVETLVNAALRKPMA